MIQGLPDKSTASSIDSRINIAYKIPRERPIIFTSDNARAILDDYKSQTRRILKHLMRLLS